MYWPKPIRPARIIIPSFFLLPSLNACTEPKDMVVHCAYGPGIKFSGLGSSFAWTPALPRETGDPRVDNPNLHALIRDTVDAQLRALGFTWKNPAAADFWVDYYVARRDPGALTSEQAPRGALVLRVIDPKTEQLIWQGTARAALDDSASPDARKKRINDAVQRIFEHFPPKDG